MCGVSNEKLRFPDRLRDPLIRLVMASDGATEQDMIALVDRLRRTVVECLDAVISTSWHQVRTVLLDEVRLSPVPCRAGCKIALR
jgi:hypothetical protein